MTMDIQKNYQTHSEAKKSNPDIESARNPHIIKSDMQSTVLNSSKSAKRSFDVAFLMMPDEKIRSKHTEKQIRVSKQLFDDHAWDQNIKIATESNKTFSESYTGNNQAVEKHYYEDRNRANNNVSPPMGSEVNIDVGTDEYPDKVPYCSDSDTSDHSRSRPESNESASRPRFESPFKNKIFDDPSLISVQSRARYESRYIEKPPEMSPKSAFTKVSNYALRSPSSSMSPDNLIYQNSISPPLSATNNSAFNKSTGFNNLLTPAHLLNSNSFFKNQNMASTAHYPEVQRSAVYRSDQGDMKPQHNANKLNFMPFRSDMPPYLPGTSSYPFGVPNFQSPNSDFMKMPQREPVNPLIVNPAAAILSTLLPPTLAAFSLPAQNVCAKCNISFRMTSDLVYHMRTHHKSESVADPHRRKREEKLKCSVCNESFRERHHLTRHMTAHQDKEGDDENPQSLNKKNKQFYAANVNTMLQK